jgi:hypothetical protein
MTKARLVQCSAVLHGHICAGYHARHWAAHTQRGRNSRFKQYLSFSHVREVQGSWAVDLDNNFVFCNGIVVLSLAEARVSLKNENVREIRSLDAQA